VVRLSKVTAPLNVISPAVSVKATVVAFTVLLNVVPPLLVISIVLILFAPTAPLTVIAPVVCNVKFAVFAVVDAVIELMLMGVAAPVPTVKVLPSVIVKAPIVI